MEFLLFNEVLKFFIFFQSLIKKVAVITLILGKFKLEMLICGQFIAKDLILWSTLSFVRFEKSNFSHFLDLQNLLGPSKKTQLLEF